MKYTGVFLFGLGISAILIFTVFINTIPLNPVKVAIPFTKETFTFIPQGWAFFTRSPREAQVLLYNYSNDKLVPVDHQHASFNNALGLNRKSTQIMSELQIIKAGLPDSAFITTEWNFQRNIYGEIPEQEVLVKNNMFSQILCGEYVLVFQEIVPWAWSGSINDIEMPAKAIKLNIECDKY